MCLPMLRIATKVQPMVRAVLLTLLTLAGPLQAQLIYTCNLMEQSFQDSCCCEDLNQTRVPASNCVPCGEVTEQPCCDADLELTVSQDAADSALTASHATRDADPDPPQPVAVLPVDLPAVLTPRSVASHAAAGASLPWSAGTATYLLTQRLRI